MTVELEEVAVHDDQGPVLDVRDLRVWYGGERGPVRAASS